MASGATDVRVLLQTGGYCPLPVIGKVPALLAWQKHTETNLGEIQLWRKLFPDECPNSTPTMRSSSTTRH
jgi:hypothetical protein